MACAAVWLKLTPAESIGLVSFTGSDRCHVVRGTRDTKGQISASVGETAASVTCLFDSDQLIELAGQQTSPTARIIDARPDSLTAIVVTDPYELAGEVDSEAENQATTLTARILEASAITRHATPDQRHMQAVAEFCAGAGHEINNPLGSIIGQTQMLLKGSVKADQSQALETIGAQAWRIRDMIGDTMLFARPPAPQFKHTDIRDLAQQAAAGLRQAGNLTDQQLTVSLPTDGVYADVDPTQFSSLVTHLLRNAIQATDSTDPQRKIRLTLKKTQADVVSLSVTDDGQGITDPTIRRHLFDPFFSGRQAGRGLGFGLCLCWQIVRQHSGLILCETLKPSAETRFLVLLPLLQSQPDS